MPRRQLCFEVEKAKIVTKDFTGRKPKANSKDETPAQNSKMCSHYARESIRTINCDETMQMQVFAKPGVVS